MKLLIKCVEDNIEPSEQIARHKSLMFIFYAKEEKDLY